MSGAFHSFPERSLGADVFFFSLCRSLILPYTSVLVHVLYALPPHRRKTGLGSYFVCMYLELCGKCLFLTQNVDVVFFFFSNKKSGCTSGTQVLFSFLC
eukprot:m.88976 g.88976  ORF g.88976 m.88976 type:complete len:99 (+) comp14560_c0_seq1:2745-3041(+)